MAVEPEPTVAEERAATLRQGEALREALENVATAAREVDDFFGGKPGRWTLDRKAVREPLATALLSLHDYLNDVASAREALAHFHREAT